MIPAWDAFDAAEFGVDLDEGATSAEGFMKERQPFVESLPSAEGGDFEREDVGEFVNDEAGEEVGVAVDAAVGVRVVVEVKHFPA